MHIIINSRTGIFPVPRAAEFLSFIDRLSYDFSSAACMPHIVFVCQTGTCGELTHKPENATLRPGSTLRLSCRSTISDTPVAWYFTKEGLDTRQEMTIGGFLKPDFTDLFTIDSSNKYDLEATMTSDPEQYCGTYECVDNNGDRQAEKASASVASK